MFLILWLLMRRFPNLLPALGTLAVQIVLAALWSALAHKWSLTRCFRPKGP